MYKIVTVVLESGDQSVSRRYASQLVIQSLYLV